MTAKQRHNVPAILGNGEYRGLSVFLAEEGREQTDQYASRTYANDWMAVMEQTRQQGLGILAGMYRSLGQGRDTSRRLGAR